jgi:hypothetical protein
MSRKRRATSDKPRAPIKIGDVVSLKVAHVNAGGVRFEAAKLMIVRDMTMDSLSLSPPGQKGARLIAVDPDDVLVVQKGRLI